MVDKEVSVQEERKLWNRPELKRLDAGSAEAIQPDGLPDGGLPGTSRS